jgi:ribosomal protein S20
MKYPTIRIEGAILAADILDKIETSDSITGQKPADFKLEGSNKVKDEIARAWADSQSYWSIFKRKRELLEVDEKQTGTSETRNQWMIPFLGLLGYNIEFSRAEEVMGKSYAISHRDKNLDGFPIHIMGFKDNLDVKRKDSGPRMSPHALVQEYLNLTEHLYAIVTNGLQIRLLRDSSRLIKLSFLEFDLERMMDEEHYADFAILYRLLHYTRMPVSQDGAAECLIETYHANSLESGSRIREGLSKAVEYSILSFSKGFLQHPKNEALRAWIDEGETHAKSQEFYQWQLRLIYRLLFLMVIEERDLIFPKEAHKKQRDIYYDFYSINKLRKLSEKRYLADSKYSDYWQSIQNTFKLFEDEKFGSPLGILPLSGDLFGYNAIGVLNESTIDNKVVLDCLKSLSVFKNTDTGQVMRVNYASLNVEEFGSVYEGLLEYDPNVFRRDGKYHFEFVIGDGRSSSGSHYTPDELVQPLIKHSLDYIIQDKLNEDDKEAALLSITVCDVACGSGHILLNAARRIATELAVVRTGEDQPSPSAFRAAIRDVIRHCIYGVDLNPLAVELCKVALWLEAHNPNEPLNFLDHHIKCGNAIIGLAHFKELENGIADEAFKTLPGDEKEVATAYRNKNISERKTKGQLGIYDLTSAEDNLSEIKTRFSQFDEMPESTPEEISAKAVAYNKLTSGKGWYRLKQLADLQVAQFFIPKTEDNKEKLNTDAKYRTYLNSGAQIQDRGTAMAISQEKRFFHWFLEFPEVFSIGGFDCILGNPPFLGGQKLSGAYGFDFLNYIRYNFSPIGSVDMVVYFFRRIFNIIKIRGFQSLISTNTVAQGSSREGGLEVILSNGGVINHAVRSMNWPGLAAVQVSLITIRKGIWNKSSLLDLKEVETISSYLDDSVFLGNPKPLACNANNSFQGSVVVGTGFVINELQVQNFLNANPINSEVIFPYLSGDDLNSSSKQQASRYVINFSDSPESETKKYREIYNHAIEFIKPQREAIVTDKLSKGKQLGVHDKRAATEWWKYLWPRPKLYSVIAKYDKVLALPRVSKYVNITYVNSKQVFTDKVVILAYEEAKYLAILQSTIYSDWAWKNSSTLGGSTINYSPSDCFESFVFPLKIDLLENIGKSYYVLRKEIMEKINLGLTKTYNQFHNKDLAQIVENINSKDFEKKYGKETWNLFNHLEIKKEGNISFQEAVPLIFKLRELHKKMDEAVLEAYGWNKDTERWGKAIDLRHYFYEVDYLSENDRVRYTIHPDARKEVLKRLLLLNHEMHECEVRGISYEQYDAEKILEIYKVQIDSWLKKTDTLHPKTLKFLCSGEDLLPTLHMSTSKSYNPFVNEYCSALENEIQQKIFVAFNNQFQEQWEGKQEEKNAYLKEQIEKSPKASMLFKGLKANSDKYTLGNMYFFLNLIWNGDSNTVKSSPLMQEFKAFVFKRYTDKFINKDEIAALDTFIKKFRNEAAHTGEIDKNMAMECMQEVRRFINLLVDSEIVTKKEITKEKSKKQKKPSKTKSNLVNEPSPSYGQTQLFEEPNLFNQAPSNKVIKQGSLVLLKPDGRDAHWFSIGANAKDAQKLNMDSAMATKLLGKTVGDHIDFGNGFKVLDVK